MSGVIFVTTPVERGARSPVRLMFPDTAWTLPLVYDLRPYLTMAIFYLEQRIAGTAYGAVMESMRHEYSGIRQSASSKIHQLDVNPAKLGEEVREYTDNHMIKRENIGKWFERAIDSGAVTDTPYQNRLHMSHGLWYRMKASEHFNPDEHTAFNSIWRSARERQYYIADCAIAWLKHLNTEITQQFGPLE